MESTMSDNFSTEVQTAGTGSIREDTDELSESAPPEEEFRVEEDILEKSEEQPTQLSHRSYP
jgi:hypothetical protein